MSLSESFAASLRTLFRRHHDEIIREQSTFAAQMSEVNAVATSNFPQGMANIARREALNFVRNATAECEQLQDLSLPEDFEKARQAIGVSAAKLLATGSENMLGAPLNFGAVMTRGIASKELNEEVRDHLLIAQEKRTSNAKTPNLSWTFLYLQANPIGEDFLATNREYREVRQALREANYRDQIMPVIEPAVRIRDVFRAINEHRPRVIHFSGHGNQSHLALLDDQDQTKDFDGQNMADLLTANGDDVQLVVLNSCDSLKQASKLTVVVPFVIGTSRSLDDDAALIFSRTFYSAIAHGRPIRTAFSQAVIALRSEYGRSVDGLYELLSQDNEVGMLVTLNPNVRKSMDNQSLSPPEQEILEAIPLTGEIHVLETAEIGKWVRAGSTDFHDDNDASVSARFVDALESLFVRRLVREEGGTLFVLTEAGWNLKKAAAK